MRRRNWSTSRSWKRKSSRIPTPDTTTSNSASAQLLQSRLGSASAATDLGATPRPSDTRAAPGVELTAGDGALEGGCVVGVGTATAAGAVDEARGGGVDARATVDDAPASLVAAVTPDSCAPS